MAPRCALARRRRVTRRVSADDLACRERSQRCRGQCTERATGDARDEPQCGPLSTPDDTLGGLQTSTEVVRYFLGHERGLAAGRPQEERPWGTGGARVLEGFLARGAVQAADRRRCVPAVEESTFIALR